ncbi:hypothetical protein BVX97_01730 [bacterium E08(2017)]|nr:hypothetical protein BVX97_01730 [bacterium E08(2017)]
MKTYEYKGYDGAGHACRGLVEALSVKNAREKLASDGILAEKVNLSGSKTGLNAEQRADIYRQLSSLLAAGVPLEKALDLLINTPDLRNAQVILASVRDSVREGASLAVSLKNQCEGITAFESAIIESAEKSATVDIMLERLAGFMDEQRKLRASVMSALMYPSIVVGLALILAIAVIGFLVPWYRDMLNEFNMEMPAAIDAMDRVGRFIGRITIPAIGVIAFIFWRVRSRLRVDNNFQVLLDQKLFGLPVIGQGYRMLVSLRFARTMSILIGGGVSLINCLILSGKATGSAWVTSLAAKQAEDVRHGSSLTEAVRNIPPLAGSLTGWIQTGEASGRIETLMDKAGEKYEEDWKRYTTRYLTLLEPMLILLVAVFILSLILPVLMSVIDLSTNIGG